MRLHPSLGDIPKNIFFASAFLFLRCEHNLPATSKANFSSPVAQVFQRRLRVKIGGGWFFATPIQVAIPSEAWRIREAHF